VASEYEVVITPKAERDLDRVAPQAALLEALDLIEALKDEPCPLYAWQLAERDRLWAFDFWDGRYRLVYQISDKQKRVIVKAAGLREDVYRARGLYRKDQGLRLRRKQKN
jgi:mRNA-degrading endonuclease RelE of RelBE toxin-antitoxin system